MEGIKKVVVRYENYMDGLIPLSGSISLGDSDEYYFLFKPSNVSYISKYDEGEKFDRRKFREQGKIIYPVMTLFCLKSRLLDIIHSEKGKIYEFNWGEEPDGIAVRYKKLDDEIGNLEIEYIDSMGWGFDEYKDEPLVGNISTFDLINGIYGGLVDYLAENFDGRIWFDDIRNTENIYETFFSFEIDQYLENGGVNNIKNRVKLAKDRIRKEWNNVFDACDKDYEQDHESIRVYPY